MKKISRYHILGALVIVLIIKAIVTFSSKSIQEESSHEGHGHVDHIHSNETEETSNAEASSFLPTDESTCENLKNVYASKSEVKKKYTPELRFHNIHKKIEGNVYRLRFFLKDASENEIPTYLVYEENQNEEEMIVENTPYKEGELYKRIKKAEGEIIFEADAYSISRHLKSNPNAELFLHYENDVLKDLQGQSEHSSVSVIDCKY